jgi:hypothetical protein
MFNRPPTNVILKVPGEAEVHLHSGGHYEWDSFALVAVAKAHGHDFFRMDGSPLVYNQPGTHMPDLLICRPELAKQVLTKVAALNEGRALVYESDLHDLIAAAHADGRVKAVTKLTEEFHDCAIVCFGTQSGVDGAHNIS